MTEHWLEHAHGRIVAGDSELDVLADYGWVQITAEEREAIETAAGICEEHAEEYDGTASSPIAATLRNLLERLAVE
jgi:hypothetical protein